VGKVEFLTESDLLEIQRLTNGQHEQDLIDQYLSSPLLRCLMSFSRIAKVMIGQDPRLASPLLNGFHGNLEILELMTNHYVLMVDFVKVIDFIIEIEEAESKALDEMFYALRDVKRRSLAEILVNCAQ
jgi:hypothetical protein